MQKEGSHELAKKHCVPCKEGTGRLHGQEEKDFLEQLGSEWTINEHHHLEKNFSFPDFVNALAFTNRVGDIAEEEGHHPDIYLAWGKVKLVIWTHKIGGLTESDFVLAAKCEEAFREFNITKPKI